MIRLSYILVHCAYVDEVKKVIRREEAPASQQSIMERYIYKGLVWFIRVEKIGSGFVFIAQNIRQKTLSNLF